MGTWSLPQTEKKARELARMMANPIEAFVANDALYHIFGDDELSEAIDTAEEEDGSSADVRYLVASHLKKSVENKDNAVAPWEPKAIALCEKLIKKYA